MEECGWRILYRENIKLCFRFCWMSLAWCKLPAGAPFRVDAHLHAGIIPTIYLLQGQMPITGIIMDIRFWIWGRRFHSVYFRQRRPCIWRETGQGLYKMVASFTGSVLLLNIPPALKNAAPLCHSHKEGKHRIVKVNKTRNCDIGWGFWC